MFENKNKKQEEFVKLFLANNFNGLLYAATRTGKSKVIINCLQELYRQKDNQTVLWLVPTTKLRDETMPSEFKKWKADNILQNTEFACYASLKKYANKKYDVIVLDEAHHLSDKRLEYLSKISRTHLMAITATPPDNHEKRINLEKLVKPISQYKVDDAVGDSVISPYTVYVVDCPLDYTSKYIKAGNKVSSWMTTEYAQYEYLDKHFRGAASVYYGAEKTLNWYRKKIKDNPNLIHSQKFKKAQKDLQSHKYLFFKAMKARADLIYNLASKLAHAKLLLSEIPEDMRTLVLTQRINTANELSENRYHSEDTEGYDKFVRGEVNILSACRSLDEGLELPNLDVVLIQQVWSTKRQFTQRAGRALGLREGHEGKIIVLRSIGTQDEKWVNSAIEDFSNVKYVSLIEMIEKIKQWRKKN